MRKANPWLVTGVYCAEGGGVDRVDRGGAGKTKTVSGQADIPPDSSTLRSHNCCNEIRSSSNKFPLGTPI
jgi:hypothetical protein